MGLSLLPEAALRAGDSDNSRESDSELDFVVDDFFLILVLNSFSDF